MYVCRLSLGDVINPDCQIDLYRDLIDIFDPNLKPDFKSLRQNQLKPVRIILKSSKSINFKRKEIEIDQK